MKPLTLLLFLLGAATAAHASAFDDQRLGPLRLKIFGYIGETAPGVIPLANWTIDAGDKHYTFIADKMDVLSGNTDYMSIVESLAPYVPAFRLGGIDAAIRDFRATPPKQRIALEGVLRRGGGARIFMLDSVTPVPPVTPTL